ncbi:hypothetical protein D3C84_822190 [compost metagenome]
MLQESLPGFSQRDPAGTAVEQTSLQTFFKAYDLSTDMGRRNPQSLRRRSELATFGDGDELVDAFPAIVGHR